MTTVTPMSTDYVDGEVVAVGARMSLRPYLPEPLKTGGGQMKKIGQVGPKITHV